MTDERPDSLAAQAAAWVPPWERAPSAPDRAYPAAAAEPDISDDVDEDGIDEPSAPLAEPDADADLDEAGLSGDDDDFDENFEGPNPSEYGEEEVPPELGALPGEPGGPAIVDAPRELPGEETPEPTDVPGGSELPRPAVVEGASEEHANGGVTVDGPRPGDDTGEVFAIAADDAVGDGDESDLPLAEVVPDAGDETAALDAAALGADETAVLDAVDVPLLGRDGEAGSLAAGGPAVSGEAGAEPAAADADASIVPDELASIESGSAAGSASAGGSEAVALAAGASAAGGSAVGDSAGAGSAAGAGLAGGSGAGDPAAGGFSVAGASADAVGASGGGAGAGDDAESAAAAAGPARRARRARSSSGIPAQGRGGRSGAAVEEPSSRTEEIDREVPAMDDGELRAALEAILLVVDEPVAEMQLAQIVEQPTERVAGMLEDISARYTAAGHGFDLRRAAGGWRLYTRPEYAPYVERFVLDGQSVRLTQAALETLAVVAYKQPVTRSRISAIRGVNCDGVMRTLVTRGLIEECGTESETGAFLYRTTPLFLEKLGLNSVDQLPPLAPFLPDDVEEVLDASG